jgi:RNA 2',3'-cyclic 3'-phosphodiesterase
MRLFVGLDIPESIRERIASFVDDLSRVAPDIRFIDPDNFHITLKFLGETTKVDDVKQVLTQVHAPSFDVTFNGTGFFPNERQPRIFWAGIEAPPELQCLASSIDTALSPLGFETEYGPYRPHLTLARSGSGRPRPSAKDKPNMKFTRLQTHLASKAQPEFGTMTAHEFFLYESKTSSSGAQYFKLERYPLAS